MALHRKFEAMLRLDPDIAVISECADLDRLQSLAGSMAGSMNVGANAVWIGDNRNKGLAVFAFNGFAVRLAEPFHPTLRHIAPVHVTGPLACNLLAVWAQNGSGGVTRKHQLGPLRRALTKYRGFLAERPSIVAGDFNNNVFWHRDGWRINHANVVAALERLGLTSAYHAMRGEPQGGETVPTLYWRDRKKDGPTYHIDYVFLPAPWLGRVREMTVGTFEDWCGSGLSDHVPLVVDIDVEGSSSLTGAAAGERFPTAPQRGTHRARRLSAAGTSTQGSCP
jgi:exodeoxyribonuclease-3